MRAGEMNRYDVPGWAYVATRTTDGRVKNFRAHPLHPPEVMRWNLDGTWRWEPLRNADSATDERSVTK